MLRRLFASLKPQGWRERLAAIQALHAQGRYERAIAVSRDAEAVAVRQGWPIGIRAEAVLWQGMSYLRAMRNGEAEAHFLHAYELDASSDIPLQLVTYAKIMAFRWPVERRPLPPFAEDAGPQESHGVEIAYFFMFQGQPPHKSARGIDYYRLLAVSAGSARRVMPGATITLITDETTEVPEGVVDRIVRYPLRQELMVARLAATARYLTEGLAGCSAVFVDPAIYFLRDVRSVLRGQFDVGYTWRSDTLRTKQDLMPLYAGVLFVPEGRGERAAAFVNECMRCLEALECFPAVRDGYPDGIRRWWGDQLAPAAVVGWEQFYETILPRKSDRMSIAGAALRFLDADFYNFAVDRRDRGELDGRYIVNFKGERKRAMADFDRWYTAAG